MRFSATVAGPTIDMHRETAMPTPEDLAARAPALYTCSWAEVVARRRPTGKQCIALQKVFGIVELRELIFARIRTSDVMKMRRSCKIFFQYTTADFSTRNRLFLRPDRPEQARQLITVENPHDGAKAIIHERQLPEVLATTPAVMITHKQVVIKNPYLFKAYSYELGHGSTDHRYKKCEICTEYEPRRDYWGDDTPAPYLDMYLTQPPVQEVHFCIVEHIRGLDIRRHQQIVIKKETGVQLRDIRIALQARISPMGCRQCYSISNVTNLRAPNVTIVDDIMLERVAVGAEEIIWSTYGVDDKPGGYLNWLFTVRW